MNDTVFDTTVVAYSNSDLRARKKGNSLDRRIRLIERFVRGGFRLRYNTRLLGEYEEHIREYRNDVIELFFSMLDSNMAIRVPRNNLSRQEHQHAIEQRWPSHDQHLIAAALGGTRPVIYVTESQLANCAKRIKRVFSIRISKV